MKILHFADAHANKDYEKFKKSIDEIKEYLENNKIDLIVFAGDLFDSQMYAKEKYNQIIQDFTSLCEYSPIFTVYGTPSHDVRGSLDVFRNIRTKFPLTLSSEIDKHTYDYGNVDVIGLSWLMKYRLLSDEEMKLPIKDQEELFMKKLKEWVEYRKSQYKNSDKPVILVGHVQLIDSVFSNGQDISSEYHDPNWFYDICTIGIFGHIHNCHNNKNLYYSGSTYNKTWGEREDKFFLVYDVKSKTDWSVEKIKFNTPKLIALDCEDSNDYIATKNDYKSVLQITDEDRVELWITVNVGKKNQINYEKEMEWWNGKVEKIRIDLNTIKVESIKRLKDFDTNMDLVEKFKIWCKENKLKYNKFQLNKIKEISNE